MYKDTPLANQYLAAKGKAQGYVKQISASLYGVPISDLSAIVDTYSQGTAKSDCQTLIAAELAEQKQILAALNSAITQLDTLLEALK